MADNPFSVFTAAKALRERPAKIDRAMAQTTDGATIRNNDAVRVRQRVQPSSYAPSAPKQAAYGAPMGTETPRPESAVERAARGQTNPGSK